ncbi:hypothetical protein M5K25_011781 [Dendrobium thyrsiflorum]|uniref:SHSP domain-containing protein n=1 Tax=Dendrobium thyrsiflorum TaxID=117978 RepID=A0ABD0V443_DENTH
MPPIGLLLLIPLPIPADLKHDPFLRLHFHLLLLQSGESKRAPEKGFLAERPDQANKFCSRASIERRWKMIYRASRQPRPLRGLSVPLQPLLSPIRSLIGENEEKTDTWHRIERSSGSFLRSFRLPKNANVDGVRAAMENGVFTVTIPKEGEENNIAMIVGIVTDDERVHEIPAIKFTALRSTETARAWILKAGGECLTFDQLALRAPLGQNMPQQQQIDIKDLFGTASGRTRVFDISYHVCLSSKKLTGWIKISVERKREKEEKTDTWHRVERSSGSFLRRFRLPENTRPDGVKAAMENGVLTVTIPKEEVKKSVVKSIDLRLRKFDASPNKRGCTCNKEV